MHNQRGTLAPLSDGQGAFAQVGVLPDECSEVLMAFGHTYGDGRLTRL